MWSAFVRGVAVSAVCGGLVVGPAAAVSAAEPPAQSLRAGGLLPQPSGSEGSGEGPLSGLTGGVGEQVTDRLDETLGDTLTRSGAGHAAPSASSDAGSDERTPSTSHGTRDPSRGTHGARGSATTSQAGTTPAVPGLEDLPPNLCDLLREAVAQLPAGPSADPDQVFALVPDDVREAVPEPARSVLLARCTRHGAGPSPSPSSPSGGGSGGSGGHHGPSAHDTNPVASTGGGSAQGALPHTGPALGLLAVPVGLALLLAGTRLRRAVGDQE